ncbi:MAG: hypothetical protein AAGM84_01605 [Pseudomonadota bacterium]
MRAVNVIQGAQTLFEIGVSDALTGAALPNARVGIEVRPRGDDWAALPFDVRSVGAGRFAVSASFLDLKARLSLGVVTDFRLTLRCPGFETVSRRRRLLATDMQIESGAITLAGRSVTQRSLRGAPIRIDVPLRPPAVRLAGVVLRDGDLSAGIAGADVTLNGDAATTVQTDAAGRFLFPAIPLRRTVRVAATAGADTTARTHLIDYREPTNRLTLNVKTQPTN